MSGSIFQEVKAGLQFRLAEVVQDLLPGGRIVGKEYHCASLLGGVGDSCRTNLETGKGSDFASGDAWGDIIGLAAKVWKMPQGEAARELGKQYGINIAQGFWPTATGSATPPAAAIFSPILPIPQSAPEPPCAHAQYGQISQKWPYTDVHGRALAYVVRFNLHEGKAILPLCYGQYGANHPQWVWKALPEPRPLYGLTKLATMPTAPVLLVEGEKTTDAAQAYFPQYATLTWNGGANAVSKADFSPLQGKEIIIWPDNDEPGLRAALGAAKRLEGVAATVRIVLPPDTLPNKWDLADVFPPAFAPQEYMNTAMLVAEFTRKAAIRYPSLVPIIQPLEVVALDTVAETNEALDIDLKAWPQFSWEACPGILGDFVALATRDSEADPAAICMTTLVRFAAEVYGFAPNKGPHMYVGETIHPPRLFAVICGNTSKARKGTSRHPVTKLFGKQPCQLPDLCAWRLPLPSRESGGPLSTGEGLAYHVRDETDEERERWQRQNPHEPIREKGDKRLIIQDEEFASGLACTKREGNTLSMGIRCFWDSGDYAPLTKNNPITVRGAHICIITHITMQELHALLGEVQAVNGFGNRFLWICARRSKLVALPSPMPDAELASIQKEIWRLVGYAQQCGLVSMTNRAKERWKNVYPELSKEHTGLAGSIINRAEAQTLRLSLVYALLDGQNVVDDGHISAALAMWQYAQDSALYIFDGKSVDPLETKILESLKAGPLTATELSAALQRNIPKERLQPLLQQLEAQQRISISKQKSGGRPKQTISLREVNTENEKNEFSEKRMGAS